MASRSSVRALAHYYQDCRDENCMMFGCRAYKTGWLDGYDAGSAAGFAAGFAAGMASAAGSGGS